MRRNGKSEHSKARSTSNMKGGGVPWLMVRETPPFPRKSRDLSRTMSRGSRGQTADAPGIPLPFLRHTHALFTPEEMVEVTTSIKKGQTGAALQRTPSRLQQIKSQHFKSSGSIGDAMALDGHPPDLYHVPTTPLSKPRDRPEPLISARDDEYGDLALGSAQSSRPSIGGGLMMPLSEDITIGELRNQVWIYVHETKGSGEHPKATEYMGEIDVDVATPLVTRGRRRLLNAIRENSQSQAPTIWPRTEDPEVLTERNYCARRLHDFLDKRNIVQPEFLEKRVTRDRPTMDRRHTHQ
jgi:hypothetical protein